MGKAKPITKEELEQKRKQEESDALISLLMNASSRQAVCIVATLANKSKDFNEFKEYLNAFANQCKEEMKNETKK